MSFRSGEKVVFVDNGIQTGNCTCPKNYSILTINSFYGISPHNGLPRYTIVEYPVDLKGKEQVFNQCVLRPLDEVLGEIEITEVIELTEPDRLVNK